MELWNYEIVEFRDLRDLRIWGIMELWDLGIEGSEDLGDW